MPIRYYVCPIVGAGSSLDPYRPRVSNHPTIETSAAIDFNVRNWCFVRVRADDFTSIDADPECVDIMERLSDVSGATTRRELADWLKSQSVADVPPPARNRIQNRLTAIRVPTTGITLQTTLWEVLMRVYRVLEPHNRMEDM